jgi:predicted nucleic acid-binding protein
LLRICLDLNIWLGALIADGLGRSGTATQSLVEAVRSGRCAQGPVALVVSWGMLNRLADVLAEREIPRVTAIAWIETIAAYARQGPSLTLGGVGVLAVGDEEDRHVLETAFAGGADLLVTHNLEDFTRGDVDTLEAGRWYGARRGGKTLLIAHTYAAAAWLRGEDPPDQVEAFIGPGKDARG